MEKPILSRRFYTDTVQNFLVVWLEENIDEVNDTDCQNTIIKLREVVNEVNTFTNMEECVTFINNIKVERVFLISSDALGQTIVPIVHNMVQVNTIYIFCRNKLRHEQWTKQWFKIKGVFTDIQPISEVLKKSVHECDRNTISMSFVPMDVDTATTNLGQLDQSFMYTQILKEILLTIDFQREHCREFIVYCREKFIGNPVELRNVDKLEQEYRRHPPIWWYTSQSFLFSMLNRALRIMDVDLIIKLGFFLSDLHQHITRLHSEQYHERTHPIIFTVYRGQGVYKTDFDQLVKTQDGLLSFNNFLSTSLDGRVALAFAESNQDNPDLIGVFFQISVNSSASSTPFGSVRDVGYYPDEEEILFSMHSIFRIGRIKQIDGNDRLWQVELTLTGDQDPQLHALTEYIREETSPHEIGWKRLGQLLIKLGRFDKAQQVYDVLLAQASDDREKANIYHQLGMVKKGQGEYAEAITYAEKALEINQKYFASDHSALAASYYIIGVVYHKMGEYLKALSSHEKALEINQKILPPNYFGLATSHENIGDVYYRMGEYLKALSFHEKALEIKQKTLPPNHPDLATSYNNIGTVYNKMTKYLKALSFHEKALEIKQKTLPSNHPDLATSYNNIGLVYNKIGEYSKALSFHEKAINIKQEAFLPNHPSLATSYNNIGTVYDNMGEYSKALEYYEKDLEISKQTLPPNHPDFATCYNNIGKILNKIGAYSKALSYHERALRIWQRTLPENHFHLAISHNNIGLVYDNMREYSKAYLYYERAVEIGQHSLPESHSRIREWENNLDKVKKEIVDDMLETK